mmetsp:Transcript_30726/g.47835  ORF Transcript_30726/g.47835 Transcript_30726/m.47835 type:complete len:374 (+) Transcript_30726:1676-2797(+)
MKIMVKKEKKRINIPPKGEEAIRELWSELDKKAEKQSKLEKERREREDRKRERQLIEEEEKQDREKGIAPGFVYDDGDDNARFDFTPPKLAREVERYGNIGHQLQPSGNYAVRVAPKSYICLPVNYFPVYEAMECLPAYTIALHFSLSSFPANKVTLIRTRKPNSVHEAIEIGVGPDGSVGMGEFYDGSIKRITPRKFHFLVVVVDSFTTTLSLFLDGEKVVGLQGVEELVTGGSVLGEEGLCLFGSANEWAMGGGDAQSCKIFSRALSDMEIFELQRYHEMENQWNCLHCSAANNNDILECGICHEPRTILSSGQIQALEAQNPLLELIRAVMPPGQTVTQDELDTAIQEVGEDPEALVAHFLRFSMGDSLA